MEDGQELMRARVGPCRLNMRSISEPQPEEQGPVVQSMVSLTSSLKG